MLKIPGDIIKKGHILLSWFGGLGCMAKYSIGKMCHGESGNGGVQ